MKQQKTATAPEAPVITAYKGFHEDWTCRCFQYEVGKTYQHDDNVEVCYRGFHACVNPIDVLYYYPAAGSRYAVVRQSGQLSYSHEDSKIASQTISIGDEISIADLVQAAIEYTASHCQSISDKDEIGAASAVGDNRAATATRLNGVAWATGQHSTALATNIHGTAAVTGNYSAASATGTGGVATATGRYSAASVTTQEGGSASATGRYSGASAQGDESCASVTGHRSAAFASGQTCIASATGGDSQASVTGNYCAALATGVDGAASAAGKASIAVATGWGGRARADQGCALVLVYRSDDGDIVHIRASKVGENGIQADVWYTLNAEGEFEEAQID